MEGRSLGRAVLWRTVVYGALLFGLFQLLMPAHSGLDGRHSRRCARVLTQIGQALHQYHDTYGSLPPAWVPDEDGTPMHSWRVLILPFLGEEERQLYEQYRFDEPWDGPNNRRLHDQIPLAYFCRPSASQEALTTYLAVVGPETAWPGPEPLSVPEFPGRVAGRILVVESDPSDIHWMEPRDLALETMSLRINDPHADAIRGRHRHRPEWFWERPYQFAQVLTADGSVRRLRESTDPRQVEALLAVE